MDTLLETISLQLTAPDLVSSGLMKGINILEMGNTEQFTILIDFHFLIEF